jgi:aspartyl protease family protein
MLFACGVASAQTVTLNGSHGSDKALLVIDGQPRALTVGQTALGVKLLAVGDGEARIEIGGRALPLRIGVPTRVGAASRHNGSEIVLTAGSGGHFVTPGSVNGRTVRFMVDTGATTVAMSQADAEHIGIAYRDAPRGMTRTAGGPVPVYLVRLNSVRVGDVEAFDVEAVVIPAELPYILLGNSFLTRFQMLRENDTLRLVKRP